MTYKESWNPVVSKMVILRREPASPMDKHAVAVFKDGTVVDNISHITNPEFSELLMIEGHKQGPWQSDGRDDKQESW